MMAAEAETFDEIRQRATNLLGLYTERDAMFEALRRMFHMEWGEKPAGDWIKETMSPTAYNSTIGAVRLLTATEPQFSVPYDEAEPLAREASEDLERAARAMWAGSGRVAGRPVHYDLVLSGLLFSEICASVTKTSELVKYAEESKDARNIARMKAVARRTPYLFRAYDPRGCYPDFDAYGLRAVLRRQKTTWGEVLATWGQAAADALGLGQGEAALRAWPADREVQVNDWYDWGYRAVWLDEVDEPIYCAEHGLEFLPVVAQITEGTNLFGEPHLARFPFLYSVWKSGMWNRENLMLTVIYSMIHQVGSYPLLLRKTSQPGSPLLINRTGPSQTIDIEADEDLRPLIENVVDPTQWQGLTLAQRYNEQSTIPTTTLGAQPQHALAYSAISLLAQSGRLPLLATKELGGAAIADLVISALIWWKRDADKATLYRRGKKLELDPARIPEDVPLECRLEPDLPQDRVQLADVAERLTRATLVSRRWVREHLLGVGQNDAMDREVYGEQFLEATMARMLQEMAQPGGGGEAWRVEGRRRR